METKKNSVPKSIQIPSALHYNTSDRSFVLAISKTPGA